MKTTIKTFESVSLVVEPSPSGGVKFSMEVYTHGVACVLDEAQCGALIFGMEQALDVLRMRAELAAAL